MQKREWGEKKVGHFNLVWAALSNTTEGKKKRPGERDRERCSFWQRTQISNKPMAE